MKLEEKDFVPCTREVSIGRGVVYRPLRSWHSGTYAGEALGHVDGDRSGCVWIDRRRGPATTPPKSVVHRAYWNTRTLKHVSAILSYPFGLGAVREYFWEANIGELYTRWVGDQAEEQMEAAILDAIGDRLN